MNLVQNEQPYYLDPSQKVIAAEVLANAFQNDPMYRYVIPNDEERERNLIWLMRKVVQYSLVYGRVYITSGNGRGHLLASSWPSETNHGRNYSDWFIYNRSWVWGFSLSQIR